MSSFPLRLRPKSRSRHLGAWWTLGLAVGGIASALGLLFYRTRWRFRLASEGMSEAGPIPMPSIPTPEPVAAGGEWMAGGKAMDTLVPSAYAVPDAAAAMEGEPWLGALRLAMDKDPRELGYDRSAWTAPLLGRYLLDTLGVSVPLPQLRGAIKDLGYRWAHTHYVRTGPASR